MINTLKKNLVVHPQEEQLALCPLTPRTTGVNYEGLGGDVENPYSIHLDETPSQSYVRSARGVGSNQVERQYSV